LQAFIKGRDIDKRDMKLTRISPLNARIRIERLQALLQADAEEPDIVTPEQAKEWWGDYDRLQKTLANDWLRDYMRAIWRRLEGRLNRDTAASEVQALMQDLQRDLIAKWTGTADDPGVIAKLFMAGMGAGQAALDRSRTNMNPAKAVEVAWELVPSDAIAAIQKYVGKLIREIDGTTLTDVQTIIMQWLESGGTIADLTRQLSPVFNDPDRAALIAQTESNQAYTQGAITRWQEVGVEEVKWRVVRDSHVCDLCEPLAGKVSTVQEGFDGGFLPPRHPRCRCYLSPVL